MCENEANINKYKIVELTSGTTATGQAKAFILDADNLGLGIGIYSGKTNNTLYFKSLIGSGDTQVFEHDDEIVIYSSGNTGAINNASNGLTVVGDNITLGGNLTGNTIINLNSTSRRFVISGATAASLSPALEISTSSQAGQGSALFTQSGVAGANTFLNEVGISNGSFKAFNRNLTTNQYSNIQGSSTQIRLDNYDTTGKYNRIELNNNEIKLDLGVNKDLNINLSASTAFYNLGNTSNLNLNFTDGSYFDITKNGIDSYFYNIGQTRSLQSTLTDDQFKFDLFDEDTTSSLAVVQGNTEKLYFFSPQKIEANTKIFEATSISGAQNVKLRMSVTGGTIFSDNRSAKKGIEYAGNYSSGFTKHSLVDKHFVTGITSTLTGSSSTVTASNGLTKVGNTIKLGGSLVTGDTYIQFANGDPKNIVIGSDAYDNSLTINGTSASLSGTFLNLNSYSATTLNAGITTVEVTPFKIELVTTDKPITSRAIESVNGYENNFKVAHTGVTFSSTVPNFEGVKYAADYSADFTKHSLVDKHFVTGITSTISGSTGASYNGLVTLKSVGSSYTVLSSDAGKTLEVTGSTDSTITFTSGLTNTMSVTINNLMLLNKVTIAAGTGVTLELKGAELLNQYDGATLYKTNNKIRGFGNL